MPARAANLVASRHGAGTGVEHVNDLRDHADAGKGRDRLTLEAQRAAFAVPVLVEIEDALRDLVGKAHLAGDVSTLMASGLDELLDDFAAVEGDAKDGAETLSQTGLHAGMFQNKAEDTGETRVDELEVAFDGNIVSEIELADAGGIRRAADILEQQGVVEIGKLVVGHAQRAADVEADPAAADTVTCGLTFRQIEGVTQGADELGKADPAAGAGTGLHLRLRCGVSMELWKSLILGGSLRGAARRRGATGR